MTDNVEIPHYKNRADYRMKQEPSERRLAIKSILDKWVACTISVEDAEKQLQSLFATPVGECDIDVGSLKIKTKPHGCSFDGEFIYHGMKLVDFDKITITFEPAKRTRMVLESKLCDLSEAGLK